MSNESGAARGGVGFFGALGITFIALKLCGVIDWEWWLVLAPLWVPVLVWVAVAFIVFVFAVIFAMMEE